MSSKTEVIILFASLHGHPDEIVPLAVEWGPGYREFPEDLQGERDKAEKTGEYGAIGLVSVMVDTNKIKEAIGLASIDAGDKGGFVESEDNLSQDGNCWVYGMAQVYGNALVYGNARVYRDAQVHDNAQVYGKATILRSLMKRILNFRRENR